MTHFTRKSVPNLIFCLLSLTLTAQVSFRDATAKLPSTGFYSWMQKGVADMNNDGYDDVVRANRTGSFFILSQHSDTTYSEIALGQIQPNTTPLSVILGDLDNNNYPDILTGGEYNGVRMVLANSSATSYQSSRLPSDSVFVQASAMADINNDGLLDIFVCNDDSTSAIWRNLGNGNFSRSDMGIHLATVPKSDNSGNYGIVFTDFDNDGDQDFYISKCRAGVTNPADPRRINQLFVNNGQNQYSEQAALYGLKDDSQSWISDFQDIDNDGDMDVLIVNHYSPSRLLENDGTGHFTEITNAAGLGALPNGILQALLRDFDNDGYVDLLCAGLGGAVYYKNNKNKTFTLENLTILNPNASEQLRSFVIGDLNHDGFQDIYASYYWGNTAPDRLWLNNKNSHHFIAIKLLGTQSNRSAIGARVTLTADGKTQIREVRAGESYGISNSLTQYFGLGNASTIDKIDILWPSGQRTSLSNPSPDQFLTLTEPLCLQTKGTISVQKINN